jgi:hypothetical protein
VVEQGADGRNQGAGEGEMALPPRQSCGGDGSLPLGSGEGDVSLPQSSPPARKSLLEDGIDQGRAGDEEQGGGGTRQHYGTMEGGNAGYIFLGWRGSGYVHRWGYSTFNTTS